MAFIFPALIFVVFLFCVAFSYREGMWGNAITLVNIIIAGLLAVNFWEPLARMLEDMLPSFTFVWDMIALWGVFCLSLLVFRTATRGVSKYQVRFKQLHDQIGSVVFAVLLGAVMVCFTTMTLHTAPLGRNFLFGGFQPEKKMFFGLAPDIRWLDVVNKLSTGSLKRWTTREFDPEAAFIDTYANRRQLLEDYAKERKGFSVQQNDLGSRVPKR